MCSHSCSIYVRLVATSKLGSSTSSAYFRRSGNDRSCHLSSQQFVCRGRASGVVLLRKGSITCDGSCRLEISTRCGQSSIGSGIGNWSGQPKRSGIYDMFGTMDLSKRRDPVLDDCVTVPLWTIAFESDWRQMAERAGCGRLVNRGEPPMLEQLVRWCR